MTRRVGAAGLRVRRPIIRPELTQRHKQACLVRSGERLNWNIRSLRRIHWSDESKFTLCHIDVRLRLWRVRGTTYEQRHVVETTATGGGSVTVWGLLACFSNDCKLAMHVLDGTFN